MDRQRHDQLSAQQVENNSPEQALLCNFPEAADDAVIDSSESHENQRAQYLNNPELQKQI